MGCMIQKLLAGYVQDAARIMPDHHDGNIVQLVDTIRNILGMSMIIKLLIAYYCVVNRQGKKTFWRGAIP